MFNIVYHGTKLYNANRIIAQNALRGTQQDRGATVGRTGIFLTRSRKHATVVYGMDEAVVFVLNKDKLRTRYAIEPIKNWPDVREDRNHKPLHMIGFGGNEFEEFLETSLVPDLDLYIEEILVFGNPDLTKYPEIKNDDRVRFVNGQ